MSNYNLTRGISDISKALLNIKTAYEKSPRSIPMSALVELKNALNKALDDSKCREVIFTNNTDKMFFGMCVIPMISEKEVHDILLTDEPIRINEYYLEIDSKLLDPMLDMSVDELTAVVLHEVGHLVGTSVPVDKVRKEIDAYLLKTNETINIESLSKNPALMVMAIKDAIRKVTSMFETTTKKDEIKADNFVLTCGYGEHLISGFKKIQSKLLPLNKNVNNKFMLLIWAMQIYKNFGDRRIIVSQTLRKAKNTTGSALMKREADTVINDVNKIDIPVSEADNAQDIIGMRSKYKFKYNILRKYEDDYYEHALRVKTTNLEDDALILLRQINSRLSVIEEFLNTVELSDPDRVRFSKLYNKYMDLRDTLGKKNIVKSRQLALWVEYPEFE